MNGKEVFQCMYNNYSIKNVENVDTYSEVEEEIIEEDVKGEANMNDGDFLIEEMTQKLKQLYENNSIEILKEVKEKELISFEEDGSIIKLDSIDEYYIEDLSLDKLNNVKFAGESIKVLHK